jgi:ProQ/FINO family
MTERMTLTASPAIRAALARRAAPGPAPAPPAPEPASKASPRKAKPAAAPLPPEPTLPAPQPDKAAGQRKSPARTAKSVQRHEINMRISAMLAARWPEAFSRPRPLAVGIYRQIRAAVDNTELRSRDLSAFLAAWTHRKSYRAALECGVRRVNLDGSDAGPAFDEPKAAE